MIRETWRFAEFFAGGGMARLGLGDRWECAFANEWCEKKAQSYRMNFPGSTELVVADVAMVSVDRLPEDLTLAWASFPCQDLSLAGSGKGLAGGRSGTFWEFWRLITQRTERELTIPLIVLENVVGLLASRGGDDLKALLSALKAGGYRYGCLVLDGVHFVPQSRPRLFVVALHDSMRERVPEQLEGDSNPLWHTEKLRRFVSHLPSILRKSWMWWRLPRPSARNCNLSDLVEEEPSGVSWHSAAETQRLLKMMSPLHAQRVERARSDGGRHVGAVYRRTRKDRHGCKTQRAEVRFDEVSGCLRTPAGGSSRQTLLIIQDGKVRSRLLSPREAARLMGLPENYVVPANYNDAYHLAGDGLVAPAVRWLADHLLSPLADALEPVEA